MTGIAWLGIAAGIAVWLAAARVTGTLGRKKGYRYGAFLALGLLTGVVGLVTAIVIGPAAHPVPVRGVRARGESLRLPRAQLLHEVLPRHDDVSGPIVEIDDIHLTFAGVKAIDGVSFSVENGEIFALIGPNGAGKTSIFNSISGVYRPQKGEIRFMGRQLIGMKPDRIADLGVARTFQNIELFPQMTVLDNLMLGRHQHVRYGTFAAMLRVGRASGEEARNRAVVEGIIEFLEIQKFRKAYVAMLPYGIQKRIELGRALAMEPRLLLLDEPVAGMNLEETEDMARFITDIKRELQIGIVLVEHDMRMVMDLADHVLALDFGKPIALGRPAEIQSNPDVVRAYLGEEHAIAEEGAAL